MILIKKKREPSELAEYRLTTGATYKDAPKAAWRRSLCEEQGFICAYCMCRISDDNSSKHTESHIEHVIPQHPQGSEPNYQNDLNYSNTVAVCPGNKCKPPKQQTCDTKRGNREPLYANPLKQSVIASISYKTNGTIWSTDSNIDADLNETLNLNYEQLKNNRLSAVNTMRKMFTRIQPVKSWKTIALTYKNRLLGTTIKEPYLGILVFELDRIIRKSS